MLGPPHLQFPKLFSTPATGSSSGFHMAFTFPAFCYLFALIAVAFCIFFAIYLVSYILVFINNGKSAGNLHRRTENGLQEPNRSMSQFEPTCSS